MIAKNKFNSEIYIDGLCKKVTRSIIESNSKYVNNLDLLSKMFNEKAQWIGSLKKRKDAIRKGGIFITTSGMLQGGPVMDYIKEMWHDEKNKIMLMGYQCKRTNGRNLMEEGFVYIDGWKTFVKCKVEKYDFSGHADKNAIQELIKRLNPNVVVFQHGDEDAILALKEWADTNTKSKIYTPIVGDSFEY
jgi:putative mRNA 3-end processing factor